MWAVEVSEGRARSTRVPRPAPPASGRVTVELRSSSLNGSDARLRRRSAKVPARPGIEFCGAVVELGDSVDGLAAGQLVHGLSTGCHAEFIDVAAANCLPVPEWMDVVVAGALVETFTTAHDALITIGRLRPGQRLLVSGAAGGVGTAAVQVGASTGADVTGTVRDPDLRARVSGLADGVAAISPADIHDAGPFDVVLELVSGDNMPANLQALNPHGRVVVIGSGAQDTARISLRELRTKRALITGSTLKDRTDDQKAAALRSMIAAIIEPLRGGRMSVPIEDVFSFEAVEDAHIRFTQGGKFGKIALVAPDGPPG